MFTPSSEAPAGPPGNEARAGPRTRPRQVLAAICGGVAIAAMHGKMAASIPVLRADLGLSLTEVGVLASVLPLGTALLGALGAQLAGLLGNRLSAAAGLALCAAGSFAGALADGYAPLLATRVVESAGYLLAVVSLPTLAGLSAGPKRRPLVMGVWAGFIPLGLSAGLLAGTVVLGPFGWQGMWVLGGAFAGSVAVAVAVLPWPDDGARAGGGIGWTLRRPVAWALAAAFLLFSFQFTGMAQFLTSMLADTSDIGLPAINAYIAAVIFLNLAGNVAGGRMVGAGRSLGLCFAVALVPMAACLAALLWADLPLGARLAAGVLYGAVSGILPGAIWAYLPTVFEHGRRTTALTGVVMQGASIGQLAGPVAIGLAVDLSGTWSSVIALMTAASAAGIALGFLPAARRRGE